MKIVVLRSREFFRVFVPSIYIRNFSWLFAENSLMMAANLVLGVVFARYLGPTRMGEWSFAQSYSAVLAVVGTLGVQQIAIRDLVPGNSNSSVILGSVIGLRLAGSILIFLTLIGVATTIEAPSIRWLLVLFGSTHFFRTFSSYDALFQAQLVPKYGVIARLSGFFVLSGLKLTAIFLGASLVWFGLITLLASMLEALVFIVLGREVMGVALTTLRFNRDNAVHYLQQSWPLILSGFSTAAYLSIDKIMLRSLTDDATVGIYAVASNLAVTSMFAITVLCQSFYPFIVRAKEAGEILYLARLRQLYGISIWFSVALAVGLVSLSGWLIPVLLGQQYADAVSVFRVLAISGVFVSITLVSSYWLMVENLQRFSFYRNAFGLVVNVFLNSLLIPRYGMIGAAMASVVSRAMATVGFMMLVPALRLQLTLIYTGLNPKGLFPAHGQIAKGDMH